MELVDQSAEIEALLTSRRRSRGRGLLAEAGEGARPRFLREPLDLETAQRFFPALKRRPEQFTPNGYYRYPQRGHWRRVWKEHPDGGWVHHVNSLGMLEEEEPYDGTPDLRILVTGDSHTEGVCATRETFPNVLEALIAMQRPNEVIEVLNAGLNGYNFYNYVGVLEAFLELEPDLFVVCSYGGNDFSGMMSLQRYFHRRPSPSKTPFPPSVLIDVGFGLAAQEFLQACYFLNNPDDEEIAAETLELGSLELARICRQHDVDLLIVYLPPPTRGQPELEGRWVDELLLEVGIGPEAVAVSDRIADRWLAFLESQDIGNLDLRPLFREQSRALYWRHDHHINVRAQRLIAGALLPYVQARENLSKAGPR